MIRTTKLAYIFMFLGSGINFAIPLSGTNTHSGWGFIGFISGRAEVTSMNRPIAALADNAPRTQRDRDKLIGGAF